MSQKKLLIIFPTPFEAQNCFAHFSNNSISAQVGEHLDFENNNVNCRAFVMGYGCECSFNRVEKVVAEFTPDALLLIGFCGACKENIKLGDFFYQGTCEYLETFAKAINATPAKIYQSERIAGQKIKQQVSANYDIVDMEYRSVSEICAKNSIPFLCLRCTSDKANHKVPEAFFNALMGLDGKDDFKAAKRTFWRHPFSIFLVLKLFKDIKPVKKMYDAKILEFIKSITL